MIHDNLHYMLWIIHNISLFYIDEEWELDTLEEWDLFPITW